MDLFKRERAVVNVYRKGKKTEALLHWSNNPAATAALSGEIRLEGCKSHKEVVFSY